MLVAIDGLKENEQAFIQLKSVKHIGSDPDEKVLEGAGRANFPLPLIFPTVCCISQMPSLGVK